MTLRIGGIQWSPNGVSAWVQDEGKWIYLSFLNADAEYPRLFVNGVEIGAPVVSRVENVLPVGEVVVFDHAVDPETALRYWHPDAVGRECNGRCRKGAPDPECPRDGAARR